MAVKSAHQLLHLVKNVSIDVDCSIISYKLLHALVGLEELGKKTTNIMIKLTKAGFVVMPICDPPNHRHHTIQCIVKKEKARIKAAIGRCEVTAMTQRLRSRRKYMLMVIKIRKHMKN